MNRLIAAAATACLALTGLAAAGSAAVAQTGGASAPAARNLPPGLSPCDATAHPGLASLGGQCGYLYVPLDYSNPMSPPIKLAISVIEHKKTAKYQGIMLVNPGGPGGSGLDLAVLGHYVPKGAGDGYDWIGFDPRGVGSSVPALQCDPTFFDGPRPNYNPTTKALETTWLAKAKGYADACASNDKIGLLNHLKTTDSVADMESIRQAFGKQKINYYGFSYGTYLGAVYATLHPHQVRRLVLDSVVDPRKVWYQANLDQDVAFERNVKIWFSWVAKHDSFYHLGKTEKAVQKLWYAQRDALNSNPAGTKVKIGPDEWTDIFLYAGYYRGTWTGLANDFKSWVKNHDSTGIEGDYINNTSLASDGGASADNGFAVYNGVQCTDVQWPTSWSQWRRDNDRVYAKAPFETWANAWFNAPCLYWHGTAGTPVKVDGKKVGPALLIDETNDAATPYPGSVYTRGIFPQSRLLAEPNGATHADSLLGDACVDNTIAAYLATGALPARTGKAGYGADKLCAPLPDPNPTVATTKSRTAQDVLRLPHRVHI